jgi:hypothetical protein
MAAAPIAKRNMACRNTARTLPAPAMDSVATWWLVGTGLGLAAVALVGDWARKRAPLAWHAHLPWNALIFVGLAVALFGIVHLLTLLRVGGA